MAEDNTVELSSIEFPGDPSSFPTIKEVPLGTPVFEVKAFAATKTKPTSELSPEDVAKGKVGEKLMITAQLSVVEPEDYKGLPYTHRFIIGSNTDPAAQKESTWKTNATELMQLLKESGVNVKGMSRVAEACGAAVGNRVQGEVKIEKSRDSRFSDKNVVRKWMRVGTKPVTIVGEGGSQAFGGIPAMPSQAPTFNNND